MKAWSYRVIPLAQFNNDLKDLEALLEVLGVDGWELVSIDDRKAVFKQPAGGESKRVVENALRARKNRQPPEE